MENLRGTYSSLASWGDDDDAFENEIEREAPPPAIGQDERRMQVRAYNHWAGLLTDRHYPAIEDLEPEQLPDFAPYSVLLDFSNGIENPGIAYLGHELARECQAEGHSPAKLADVPSRSLLSRITDHYMQILANEAPIGFEAEFVNQHGATILYRGILLPFSSDDDTIDFIYGVINWKELVHQDTADELLLEIDQALEADPLAGPRFDLTGPLTDWADGPATPVAEAETPAFESHFDAPLPRPSFGLTPPALAETEADDDADDDGGPTWCFALPRAVPATPVEHGAAELTLRLAEARDFAEAARASDDRTRAALYDAIGHAYDFSLATAEAPLEFERLLSGAGLTAQTRAPMTPVVKLVFGADYDKTRVTEYAAALDFAHRLQLPPGTLGDYLATTDGGLKSIVSAERAWRREQAGKPAKPKGSPRPALARKLRALPIRSFADIASGGSEFALVMIRRTAEGIPVVLGEVPEEGALIERAGRKLVD